MACFGAHRRWHNPHVSATNRLERPERHRGPGACALCPPGCTHRERRVPDAGLLLHVNHPRADCSCAGQPLWAPPHGLPTLSPLPFNAAMFCDHILLGQHFGFHRPILILRQPLGFATGAGYEDHLLEGCTTEGECCTEKCIEVGLGLWQLILSAPVCGCAGSGSW